MTISDYSKVDFIEIFNNPEPLHEVNERGTNLWMSLIFSGYQITATSGMDLPTVRAGRLLCNLHRRQKRRQHRFRARYRHSHAPHLGFQRRSAADGGSPETNELLLTFTDAHKPGFAVPKNSSGRFKKEKTKHSQRAFRSTNRYAFPSTSSPEPIRSFRCCMKLPRFLRQRCRSFDILQQYCGCQLCCRAAERNRRASCNRRTALASARFLQD